MQWIASESASGVNPGAAAVARGSDSGNGSTTPNQSSHVSRRIWKVQRGHPSS